MGKTVTMPIREYEANKQAVAELEQTKYSLEEVTEAVELAIAFIRNKNLIGEFQTYLSEFPQPIEDKVISADTTLGLIAFIESSSLD